MWRRSIPLVEVGVNGKGTALFVLDTGFGVCAVDAEWADGIELETSEASDGLVVVASDGRLVEPGGVTTIDAVRLGEAELVDLPAAVEDLSHLEAALGVEVDGILGFAAFADCAVVIDFPGESVRLVREDLGDPDDLEVLAFDTKQLVPHLPLRVQGRELDFMVDTGSNESIAIPRSIEGLRWSTDPIPFALTVTAAGESERLRFGRLAGDVALGRHTLREPIVCSTPGSARLGCDLLESFEVAIDRRAGVIRLQRPGDDPIEEPSWRSHGAGFLTTSEGTFVGDVIPGSPAEAAGLAIGDEVVHHGSEPSVEYDAPPVPDDFDGIHVCLRRDGRIETLAIPIAVLLR